MAAKLKPTLLLLLTLASPLALMACTTTGTHGQTQVSATPAQDGRVLRLSVILGDPAATKAAAHLEFKISTEDGFIPDTTLRTDNRGQLIARLPAATYTITTVNAVTLKGRTFSWTKTFVIEDGKDCVMKLTTTDVTDMPVGKPVAANH